MDAKIGFDRVASTVPNPNSVTLHLVVLVPGCHSAVVIQFSVRDIEIDGSFPGQTTSNVRASD